MELLRGFSIMLVIMLVAGLIAYIGDRVGHQVGRRRMTLFNLRPKYTSTIVAVATGMLIALSVTLLAILSSKAVQDAFFRLGTLNSRIAELQAQADALQDKTRNGDLVIPKARPLVQQFVVIQPRESRESQLAKLAQYFDATVKYVNGVYTQSPFNLKPYPLTSKDSGVRDKLQTQLDTPDIQRNLRTDNPVLMLAVSPENLYRGDQLSFSFASWQDHFVFARGQQIAELEYPGGFVPILDPLFAQAIQSAVRLGMPYPFAQDPRYEDPAALARAVEMVARAPRGTRWRVTVSAAQDTYAHTGGLIVRVAARRG